MFNTKYSVLNNAEFEKHLRHLKWKNQYQVNEYLGVKIRGKAKPEKETKKNQPGRLKEELFKEINYISYQGWEVKLDEDGKICDRFSKLEVTVPLPADRDEWNKCNACKVICSSPKSIQDENQKES